MLTGQNGILNRAGEAKEKTELASKDEQRKLAQAEAVTNTERTTYKGVTLPAGFAPTKIDGEDSIDDGLVITDGYGNEYIWVEVPRSKEVYPTAGIEIKDFTDIEYQKIEEDLHTYTTIYRNGTEYKDEFAEDTTTGWFKSKEEYDNAKKKMLKSVYENNGFWIGRYEAGILNFRTNPEQTISDKPASKINMYPYTYVSRTQAKTLAESVSVGEYTSSLMFGVQWDLTLKYIENKMKNKVNDIQKLLNTTPVSIGNFSNSEFLLNRGEFSGDRINWYNFDSEDATYLVTGCKKLSLGERREGTLLTTGATDVTKLQNIYDIAGNVWEWTLEKTKYGNSPCTARGGAYYRSGNDTGASFRGIDPIENSAPYIGFRVAIY